MDASGDALFPQRYLDEFEKRISELHRCAELARGRAVQTMHQTVALLLDAADAHEQAAEAYELAGVNGHATDFQARAMRHRHAAAARRAAAAAMASRIPDRRDGDGVGSQAVIADGEPLGLPGPIQAGQGYLWVSCGKCPQRRDRRFYELPQDDTGLRAIGPWQAVLLLAALLRPPPWFWVAEPAGSTGRIRPLPSLALGPVNGFRPVMVTFWAGSACSLL